MIGFKEKDVNIYIVDDDRLLLKILDAQFVKASKYNIYTFTSGEDFLQYYISNPIKKKQLQIVLLDLNLGTEGGKNKDGIEILKHVKGISKDVHVIILSGYITQIISKKMKLLGAVECIKKNENSFIRIHNTIKWIISNRAILDKKSQAKFALYIFLLILFVLALMGLYNFYINS